MTADPPAQANEKRDPHEKHQGTFTEEQLYVEVTRAWCKLRSRQLRRERPLRGYVFGWHFVLSVERSPVNVHAVIRSIFEIVGSNPLAVNDGVLSLPLRIEKEGPLDTVAAWWQPWARQRASVSTTSSCQTGRIVVLTLAPHDHQPDSGASQ
jgi:hypothetical protein